MKYRILDKSLNFWHLPIIKSLVDCCVVLHNMTVELRCPLFNFSDLMDFPAEETDMEVEDMAHSLFGVEGTIVPVGDGANTPFTSMAQRVSTVNENMLNAGLHFALQKDVQDFVVNNYK